MDDQNDREYSRTPELQDVINLCTSLNEQGVHYILIGGFAVILHGYLRGTKDIDLLVDTTNSNIQRIKQAMAFLSDNAISQIENDEVEKYNVIRIADEFVVDLMAKACGIDYNEAKKEIEWKDLEGVRVPVASKSLLIKMKQTVRPSDKADVEFLKWRIQEETS